MCAFWISLCGLVEKQLFDGNIIARAVNELRYHINHCEFQCESALHYPYKLYYTILQYTKYSLSVGPGITRTDLERDNCGCSRNGCRVIPNVSEIYIPRVVDNTHV